MHIVFLTHYFPPEVNAPATRTLAHCKRWVEAGHEVTVVTSAPNCPTGVVFDGYKNSWRGEEVVDGIRVIRVWTYLAANAGFLKRILNYLSYLVTAVWCAVRLRNVDVMVATSPQFFCGWAGVICHWIRRWPFVLEIRDIWPESIVNVGAMKRSPLIRMLEWLERRMYAAADRIVTVGDGYREQLLERGVPAEKISVVTNGVDCNEFCKPGDTNRFRREWDAEEAFVCSYVGTIGMAHGLEVILEAAEILKSQQRNDIRFWVIGEGASRQQLEERAVSSGLDNVRFTGILPKEDVANVIATSDACLVHLRESALFETVIPSKIFEAMALNTPVILGLCGDAEQIIRESAGGIAMMPEDAHSMLNCIETIQQNGRAFQNGRAYVELNYNRNRLAARMLQVLSETAAAGGDVGEWSSGDEVAQAA